MTMPAGWYRDPAGLLRYWDGQQWTQATQPAAETGGWQWESPPPTWTASEQPWPTPPPQRTRRRGLTALLIGGGVVVVAAVVVIVLVATGVFSGNGGKSPVEGTITDAQAGLSYPRLGGDWRPETVSPTGNLARLGFDEGEVAQVMADYQNGEPYVASAYSGLYTTPTTGSLETRARALLSGLEPAAYPAHTRQELASQQHNVGGRSGWMLKVKFSFPQAKSRGWNFRTETAIIVLVDRGASQQPGEYYISIPDSHKKQGDLDLLLSSLKVS